MQSLGAPRRQVKPSQDVDRFADAMRDEASLRAPKRSALEILATAAPESAKARLHHGFTLLHLACQYGLADCASRLLLLGADPAAPSRPQPPKSRARHSSDGDHPPHARRRHWIGRLR